MKHDNWKRISRATILAICLALTAGLSACADEEGAWPDNTEVNWDVRAQSCYLHGELATFGEPTTYEMCLELAHASVDGTLVLPNTSEARGELKSEGELCCDWYCTVSADGEICEVIHCEPC